jgi:hypothetical protein
MCSPGVLQKPQPNLQRTKQPSKAQQALELQLHKQQQHLQARLAAAVLLLLSCRDLCRGLYSFGLNSRLWS